MSQGVIGPAVTLAAVVASLLLATTMLLPRPRGVLQAAAALGMTGLAAESLAAWLLLARTESVGERELGLQAVQVAGLALLIPWGVFVAKLVRPPGGRLAGGWRVLLGAASLAPVLSAAAILKGSAFELSDLPGPFYAGRLDTVGYGGVVVQLVGSVLILAGLELCLRTSSGETRWRTKYVLLGAGGIFLVRFYLLSQVLLFGVVMASYLATQAAALVIGSVVIAGSLVRNGLRGVDLRVSRHLVYRSVVLGVLGLYLVGIGVLGWVLNMIGVTEELMWGSLVMFVSAVALAAVLLSEDVRWRLKRLITLNLYRSKYDYRDQWIGFTKRLGSLVALEDLGPQLLGAVTEAVGTARGALYLVDARDQDFHLVAALWTSGAPATIKRTAPLVGELESDRRPTLVGGGRESAITRLDEFPRNTFPTGSVVVPLRWRDGLTGIMLLGPERTGAAYTAEDVEFLTTVAEQVAGALATAQLSERLAQAREFEAFHRLTSFVIHDLKNSITALSLLSRNAQANFEDPEFQRDAMRTLARTVERMKGLLDRLTSAPDSEALRLEAVDLSTIVADATRVLKGGPRIAIGTEFAEGPAVLGDPEALLRVVQNVATNAVEALEGEGSVTITTGYEPGYALLTVRDTGCGMTEEFVRKSLFAPFRSTKKGGWGIGLYQVKGIIDGHGGQIEVTSKLGEGTTVRVRLPVIAQGAGRADS